MDGKQIGGGESTLAYDSWGIESIRFLGHRVHHSEEGKGSMKAGAGSWVIITPTPDAEKENRMRDKTLPTSHTLPPARLSLLKAP